MSHCIVRVALGAALALAAHFALAQSAPKPPPGKAPDVQEQRPPSGPKPDFQNFHAQCVGCHGIPGYHTAFPVVYHVPRIAGQQPGYIIAALKAYKSGDRSHPSMRGIAASLSEEQMKELAEYYGAPAK
jgi:cytochrome c553